MNINEIKKELEYQASLACFGDLDIKRVQKLFDLLMNHGIYHEEFIEIEYPRSIELRDFLPHFEAALKKIDITIPKNKKWEIHQKRLSKNFQMEKLDL